MNAYSKDDYAFWGLRICLAATFIVLILSQVSQYSTAPMPHGLWKALLPNHSWPYYTQVFWAASLISVFAYAQKNPKNWASWALFGLTTWAVCMEESNGIHNRNALVSWLFFAQAVAASWPNKSSKLALQFSAQVVAGTYFLSALSKLLDAGLSWPIQGQLIGLQIAKSFHQAWADFLDPTQLEAGSVQLSNLEQYSSFLPVILGLALFLEFAAPLALLNKTSKWIMGWSLVAMHLAIFISMNISLLGIAIPMFFVFINPLGWLLSLNKQT